ncbi:MAG: hypothetical protein FJ220_07065 [Kiritimatiellaceae bacterium]|nr:hypothetical protein [Kiritimatiellaceae bacterium]
MGFPEWLYTIDILFVVFVFVFVCSGIKLGLSGELAHVVTLVVLLICLFCFYSQLIHVVSDTWPGLEPQAAGVVTLCLLIVAAALLFLLLQVIFKSMLKNKMGESSEKFFGAVAGGFRGALIGVIVMSALSVVASESLYQTLSEKSLVGGWVCKTVAPWADPYREQITELKEKVSGEVDKKAMQIKMNTAEE